MNFKKLLHKNIFSLYGSGTCIRSDAQMQLVNKEEADKAFNACKKEILNPYLKTKGFHTWKGKAYVRLNHTGLLEYMDLQKERYGSKTFTVNIALMPIYAPSGGYMCIGFGGRLGEFVCGKDFWWDYKDADTAKKSFANVAEAIGQFAIPWFEKYDDGAAYTESLKKSEFGWGYPNVEWATYYYLKNGGKEAAKSFLNEYCLTLEKGKDEKRKTFQRRETQRMLDEIEKIQDVEEHLRTVAEGNVAAWKLPKSVV